MAEQIPEIEYYLIYTGEDGSMQIKYSKGMLPKLVNRR